jgi:hypothetical protein
MKILKSIDLDSNYDVTKNFSFESEWDYYSSNNISSSVNSIVGRQLFDKVHELISTGVKWNIITELYYVNFK